MCIGYCAIELRSHGIHKATEAKDLCAVLMLYTDWSHAFEGECCGFESTPVTGSFYFPSFPPLLSLFSLHCSFTQVYAVYGEGPAHLSGGPSYLRLRPQTFHWSYTWLMVVELTFDFEVQLLRSIFQKERQGYGDLSGPRILEIDPVILKLSQFSEVQSERERTVH